MAAPKQKVRQIVILAHSIAIASEPPEQRRVSLPEVKLAACGCRTLQNKNGLDCIVVSHCELLASGGGLDKRSFLAELRGVAGEAERNSAEGREAAGAGAERGAEEVARGEPAVRQQQQVRGHKGAGQEGAGSQQAMAAQRKGRARRAQLEGGWHELGVTRKQIDRNERFPRAQRLPTQL
jgi:hypothetical protein